MPNIRQSSSSPKIDEISEIINPHSPIYCRSSTSRKSLTPDFKWSSKVKVSTSQNDISESKTIISLEKFLSDSTTVKQKQPSPPQPPSIESILMQPAIDSSNNYYSTTKHGSQLIESVSYRMPPPNIINSSIVPVKPFQSTSSNVTDVETSSHILNHLIPRFVI